MKIETLKKTHRHNCSFFKDEICVGINLQKWQD